MNSGFVNMQLCGFHHECTGSMQDPTQPAYRHELFTYGPYHRRYAISNPGDQLHLGIDAAYL